jgi:hypothetical protein
LKIRLKPKRSQFPFISGDHSPKRLYQGVISKYFELLVKIPREAWGAAGHIEKTGVPVIVIKGHYNRPVGGREMDQELEFTRPASVSIQSVLKPILGDVAQFVFYRNNPCGTFVRMTIDGLVKIDVFFEPSEGWKAALYKLTKKGEINKTFGDHRELLVPKTKNIANGQLVVTAFLPVLEKFLTSTPLSKHLTIDELKDVQVKITNYKQAQIEQKVKKEIELQQLSRLAPQSAKGKATTAFWIILALFFAAILGASGSGSNDCDFYPDPRGGFTDCS